MQSPVSTRSRNSALGIVALVVLFLSPGGPSAQDYKLGNIEIDHPWARATLPGAKVAAGYLVVRNRGATPDRLIGVTVAIAAKAEIHEMSVSDGVMNMRPVPGGIEIPAGGEVKLDPGYFHIMFMDLSAPAREGERFGGTLEFENAGTVAVEFTVEKASGGHDHGG